MATYISGKEVNKEEKEKNNYKLDIFSAMAVMDNSKNYFYKNQDKLDVKYLPVEVTKNKQTVLLVPLPLLNVTFAYNDNKPKKRTSRKAKK